MDDAKISQASRVRTARVDVSDEATRPGSVDRDTQAV